MSVYLLALKDAAVDGLRQAWRDALAVFRRPTPPQSAPWVPSAVEFDPTRHFRTNEFRWYWVQRKIGNGNAVISHKVLRQRCLPHMAGAGECWMDVPEVGLE